MAFRHFLCYWRFCVSSLCELFFFWLGWWLLLFSIQFLSIHSLHCTCLTHSLRVHHSPTSSLMIDSIRYPFQVELCFCVLCATNYSLLVCLLISIFIACLLAWLRSFVRSDFCFFFRLNNRVALLEFRPPNSIMTTIVLMGGRLTFYLIVDIFLLCTLRDLVMTMMMLSFTCTVVSKLYEHFPTKDALRRCDGLCQNTCACKET